MYCKKSKFVNYLLVFPKNVSFGFLHKLQHGYKFIFEYQPFGYNFTDFYKFINCILIMLKIYFELLLLHTFT